MVRLTRLNHVPVVVNSDLIEHIECIPDTVITMTTGEKFMVLEEADEVVERIRQFRRSIHAPVVMEKSGGEAGEEPRDS